MGRIRSTQRGWRAVFVQYWYDATSRRHVNLIQLQSSIFILIIWIYSCVFISLSLSLIRSFFFYYLLSLRSERNTRLCRFISNENGTEREMEFHRLSYYIYIMVISLEKHCDRALVICMVLYSYEILYMRLFVSIFYCF